METREAETELHGGMDREEKMMICDKQKEK